MKYFTKRLRSLTFNQYFFLLIILGYVPIFFFGYFVQDDFSVVFLSLQKPIDAFNYICSVNNNRPLSCVYHVLLSRIPSIFQFYFLFTLSLYIFFIFNVIKIFDFIIDDIFLKKLFITFLIFPFFSYTVLYSPAMQSIGVVALVFWSISLLFLKQFITSNSKAYLFYSYFFILLMFLVYESPTPLLGLSIFFPLFFKKKEKLFYSNLVIIISLCILIIIVQKIFIPKIFNVDLSRLRVELYDYKKIAYLTFINLVLTINIIFFSIELAIQVLFNLFKNLSYLTLLQIFSVIYIFNKNFYHRDFYKKNENNKHFLLIITLSFFSVISLNALMHAVANTGLEFTKYNNRALVSLSFIFSLTIVLVYKVVNFKNKKLLSLLLISLFSVPIINFIYFQNNLVKERFEAKYIYEKYLNSYKTEFKSNKINFITDLNREGIANILSYNSYDYFYKLNVEVIFLNENKICDSQYFDHQIAPYFNKEHIKSLNMYFFDKFPANLISVNNFNDPGSFISIERVFEFVKCNNKKFSDIVSKDLNKKVYIGDNFNGYFFDILKYFYLKII